MVSSRVTPPARGSRPGRSLARPAARASVVGLRLVAAAILAFATIGLAPAGALAADRFPTPPPPPVGFVKPPRPVPPQPPPPNTITFFGRGYGHGVGMSQYGARGRALAGQLAPTILAHYYPKTTLGQRDPTTIVRVLVMTARPRQRRSRRSITGRAGRGPSTAWRARSRPTPVCRSRQPRLGDHLGPDHPLHDRHGACDPDRHHRRHRPAGCCRESPRADVEGIVVQPLPELLRVRLTTTVMVINHVPVDLYLRGVVPAEMPASWPAEALKARRSPPARMRSTGSTRRPGRTTLRRHPSPRSTAAGGPSKRRRTRASARPRGRSS